MNRRYKLCRNPMNGQEGLDAFHIQDGLILAVLVRERSDPSGAWSIVVWQDLGEGNGTMLRRKYPRRIDARRFAEQWVRAQAGVRDHMARLMKTIDEAGFIAKPEERFGGYIN